MKIRYSRLAAFTAATLLSACGAVAPAMDYQPRYVPVPAALVVQAPVAEPPDVTTYLDATWPQKEEFLWKALDMQTGNVLACNRSLSRIGDWSLRQATVFSLDKPGAGSGATSP